MEATVKVQGRACKGKEVSRVKVFEQADLTIGMASGGAGRMASGGAGRNEPSRDREGAGAGPRSLTVAARIRCTRGLTPPARRTGFPLPSGHAAAYSESRWRRYLIL